MKKLYFQLLVIGFCFWACILSAFAEGNSKWTVKYESQKVFIENKGQFKINAKEGFDAQVRYAYDGTGQKFYFTRSGVVYELMNIKKNKEKENEERELMERMKKGKSMTVAEHAKMEEEERRMKVTRDELSAQWLGANPDVQIMTEGKNSAYYSYSFKNEAGENINENLIPGYDKLIYKDLYPNIDVVYEMHPQGGVKYSMIVHPGGDISQVRLQYSKNAHLLAQGDIKTHSRFGDFIDHAPVTFYENDKAPVASSYILKNNIISFSVADYDHSKTIVVDPWTQSPTFNTAWHCVWECDKDGAGNVYIIGGIMPMQLLKYNSAGTLQWTYSTPYDTSNCWLGTFATDNAGNSYVTAGSLAQIEKISTAGAVVWNNSSVTGIFGNTEFWSISFNCDQTQLVVGGTGGVLLSITPYIYNIDMTSGNVLNSAEVTGGALFPTEEVRAIAACGNGNYYFLTHDSIGYIHQGLTSCLPPGSPFPFHVSNGYGLSYKCENWRTDNSGIAAIKYFGGFVYTHRGNQVHKRLFATGAIIATGTIPGGAFNTGQVSCSGIDIDSCGNVYVGSTNGVVKFDKNLNQLATYATAFNVYDVAITSTGDLIACGSTGNSSSGARSGYVQSFAASACKTIAIVCCDASICPHAAVCTTDPSFNFTSTTAGGVWSGTGITNSATGTFSPAAAGVGVFTIYYTLACGKDSTTITVNSCTSTSVCRNANGSLTVSGGTAPYTWAVWDSVGHVCQGGIPVGALCLGGTWVTTYGFTNTATGATFTPPSQSDTVKVTDNAGTVITIYNISAVTPCFSCNLVVSPGAQTNVKCFGGNTGVAHVTVSGGTTPYTYAWSAGGSTLDSAVGLSATTYTVTVNDAGGCTGTATFTITQPASAVSATSVITSAICGLSNGKVVLSPSGGTPGYTYTWSPNVSTTDSAVNLAATTYNITITDTKGCTFITSAIVPNAAGITVTPGAQTNVKCFGGTTGVAHVTVSGGTTPYTYTWSAGGSTLDSAVNLSATTYTVTVHDANNCSGTASFTITQPAAAVSATSVITSATCGLSNGKVVLSPSGGTPGYTYTWSPNVSTTDSAISLAAATYNITITDTKGCTFVTSAIVPNAAGITVTPGAQTNVKCFGGNTGVAHVTVSGGTTPYTYAWSGSASTLDSAVNLALGTYTVTVHDANGCTGTTTFNITQPTAVSASYAVTASTCGLSNGKIVVTASGGTPGYTFAWSGGVSTTDSATGLPSASYSISVMDTNGCIYATSAFVPNAAGITVTPGAQTNVKCRGASTGVAHVTVSGGTTPYAYTWSAGGSTLDSAVGLSATTYTVTVHDATGCSGTASFTITQPATIVSATSNTAPATCGNNNGKIVLTASGGTPGYTYTWSPNVSAVDSATNLSVGSYNITVTDANGCPFPTSASVASLSGFSVSPGPKTDVSCFGGNNGVAHVSVAGGTTPYTYTWSPSASTVDSAVNLIAGTYNVTVHDANNCSGTISITIAQPLAALAVTPTATPGTCGNNNGKIVLSVSGGTSGYTYLWSPNVSTTDSAVGLAANTYFVTVTDAKGCTFTVSQAVNVSSSITVSPGAQTDVSCFGGNNGAAHVTVTGGTTPYTYTWSAGGSTADSAVGLTASTYTVSVHDLNGCSGTASFTIAQPNAALTATPTASATTCGSNNGKVVLAVSGGTAGYTYIWSPNVSTVDSSTGLSANTYNVTVTDAKNCTTTVSANVTATPFVSLAPGSETDVTCNAGTNGRIHLTTTSGIAPYTYTWSPNVSTTDSAVGLSANTYNITVQDGSGCTSTTSVTVNQPPSINISMATTQAHCNTSDGSATATVTWGTGTLTYAWSAGGSTTNVDANLPAASYVLTVTDANLCQSTASASVSNIGGPTASIASLVNENCNGGTNGNIYISVAGGTPAYTYTWTPAVSTTDSAVSLPAGNYSIVVRDANNCAAVLDTTITQPAALLVIMSLGNADCGLSDGWAKATVTGGTGTYSYAWSNTQTIDSITGITGGMYRVTITDALGCSAIDSVNVGTNNGPAAPTISASGPLSFCQGDSVVLTSSAASGNTWSNGATTQSITVLASGTFTVTQTVGGCASGPSASVVTTMKPIPAAPVITASGPTSFCIGDSVVLTSSYATGNTWSNGATTQSITVHTAGIYTVSTIQGGCPSPMSAPDTVSILPSVQPHITASKPAICPGDSVVLDATTAAATAYLWSNAATVPAITVSASGFYQVTVTVGGCTGRDTITIGSKPGLGSLSLPASLIVCDGDSAILDATTLGAATYLWSPTAATPTITVKTDGTYYVTVSNSCGLLTDSTVISVIDCNCRIYMPNAFTPNDDGINDLYGPEFKCADPKYMLMRIFNRWGEKVYETTDLYGQWDGRYKGTLQEPGVYVYYVEFVGYEDGIARNFKLVGSLTIIR